MFHPYFTAETQGTRRYLLAKNKTGRIQMGASGIMKIAAVGRADIQSCKKGTFCFSPMRKAECPLFFSFYPSAHLALGQFVIWHCCWYVIVVLLNQASMVFFSND
jgi:hypothetical protein